MDTAVAVKYIDNMPAPFILCKGKNKLAEKLLRIASDHNISIAKDVDLAESLFTLETGTLIPEEYYEIIAEILVFISKVQELK